MLRNYLFIAIRNLFKHSTTSIINISGLAIGMASCLLIFIYVNYEKSYDEFHSKSDRIARVLTIDRALGVSSNQVGVTIPGLGPAMKNEMQY